MQIASQPKQVRPKGAAMVRRGCYLRRRSVVADKSQIAVGPVQTVHTSIKPRRDKIKKPPPPRKMSSSSESDGSSSDSSTDSDSDEKEQTRVTAGPHTPYKRPDIARGKSGPALTALSPTSRALGEDSRTAYTVLLATENAFPEENEGKKKARKAFIEEFDELAADVDEDGPDEETARSLRRRDRAIASTEYKHDMVHVVRCLVIRCAVSLTTLSDNVGRVSVPRARRYRRHPSCRAGVRARRAYRGRRPRAGPASLAKGKLYVCRLRHGVHSGSSWESLP